MTVADRQRPRTKPPEIRREELMDAAQRLFLEKGFAATSVAEIVEAADVAKGTFYLHFQTKDDVLAGLKIRFIEQFCQKVDAANAAAATGSWMYRFDVWMETCVFGYLDAVPLHDLVFQQFHPAKRGMKRANPIVTRLTSFLLEGRDAGAFSFVDARLTAVMLFNAMHGAVDDCLADGPSVDRQKLAGAVTDFCRRAISS
ncbi:TetR/AcrR family transcriptional regulator [Rhizobium sp. AC27/96]|uniref:TetR/AcrR family transcriptional regulator n=1 Tax=Rhizobium sp. AC27/96 TaxID=1841653 RepID=UPI0009F56FC9|nr:TetR/AcrR family transcriptional regulator [Rhizobium sp. AC27/96]